MLFTTIMEDMENNSLFTTVSDSMDDISNETTVSGFALSDTVLLSSTIVIEDIGNDQQERSCE